MSVLGFDKDVVKRPGGQIAFGFEDLQAITGIGAGSPPGAILSGHIYMESFASASVVGHAFPQWLGRIRDRIQELSTLPPGWDGEAAPPVEVVPLRSAWEFLLALSPLLRVPPNVVPTLAGGVVLEWHRSGIELEVEFTPKGEADVSCEHSTGEEFEGPLESRFPEVASTMRQLY